MTPDFFNGIVDFHFGEMELIIYATNEQKL